MEKTLLLAVLPPFRGKKVLIKSNQNVGDIMRETLNAHDAFAADYDLIADYFAGRTAEDTLRNLFDFLKENVPYKEESERSQVTKSPAAILQTKCDCKCYALFIAGVLDALNRQGKNFNWCYVYASYTAGVRTPAHVFVEVETRAGTFWVDPVLSSFNVRMPAPTYTIRKKKFGDMLYRLSGVNTNLGLVATAEPTPTPAPKKTVGQWIKENPALVAGGVIVGLLLISNKKRRRK